MKEFIAQFHFIRPAFLLLVPVVLAGWWLWRRAVDPMRAWRAQMDPDLLRALSVDGGNGMSAAAWFLLGGWLLAAIAIAGPAWRPEPSPFADDASPLLIVLKSDASMDAVDPAPSRMERAKLKIADLAQARKGQPLGLIAYAGSAHLVLPPTVDTDVVAKMAAEISPNIMPAPGDRLDLALREAARVLGQSGQGGSIVVLADSVDTDAAQLREAREGCPFAVQFLAINAPDSSQEQSLREAARLLGAKVEPLTINDDDIAAIVRGAKHAPQVRAGEAGESGGRWQEAGYWLVPLLAVMLLASFRRDKKEEVAA